MRIIAGTAKGRRLFSPPGREIRPTSDRVRENLFNILGERVQGARFLDLFCGAGGVGIEALSRGALHVTFVDRDTDSLNLTRRNLQMCGMLGQSTLARLDLPDRLSQITVPCHVIFADPPYDFMQHASLLVNILDCLLLCQDGVAIIETSKRTSLPDQISRLTKTACRIYGDTALHFFS